MNKILSEGNLTIGVTKGVTTTGGVIKFIGNDGTSPFEKTPQRTVIFKKNPVSFDAGQANSFISNANSVYRASAKGVDLDTIYNANEYREDNFIKDLNVAIDHSSLKSQNYSGSNSVKVNYEVHKIKYKLKTSPDIAGNTVNAIRSYRDFNGMPSLASNAQYAEAVGKLRALKTSYNSSGNIEDLYNFWVNMYLALYGISATNLSYEGDGIFVNASGEQITDLSSYTYLDSLGTVVSPMYKAQEITKTANSGNYPFINIGLSEAASYAFYDKTINKVITVEDLKTKPTNVTQLADWMNANGMYTDVIGNMHYRTYSDMDKLIEFLETKLKGTDAEISKVIDFQMPIGSDLFKWEKVGEEVVTTASIMVSAGTELHDNTILLSAMGKYTTNNNGNGAAKRSVTSDMINEDNPKVYKDANAIISVVDAPSGQEPEETIGITTWSNGGATSTPSTITVPKQVIKDVEGIYFKITGLEYTFDDQSYDSLKQVTLGSDSSMQGRKEQSFTQFNNELVGVWDSGTLSFKKKYEEYAYFDIIDSSAQGGQFKVVVNNVNKDVFPIDYQYLSNYLYTINNNAKGDLTDDIGENNTVIDENDLISTDYENYLLTVALMESADDIDTYLAKNIEALEEQYNQYLKDVEHSTSDSVIQGKLNKLAEHIKQVKKDYEKEKEKWGLVRTIIGVTALVAAVVVTVFTAGTAVTSIPAALSILAANAGTLAANVAIAGLISGNINSTVVSYLEEQATGDAKYGLNWDFAGVGSIGATATHSKWNGWESVGFDASVSLKIIGLDKVKAQLGIEHNILTGKTVATGGYSMQLTDYIGYSLSIDTDGNVKYDYGFKNKAGLNISTSVTVNPFVNGPFVRKAGINAEIPLVKDNTKSKSLNLALGLMIDTASETWSMDDLGKSLRKGLTAGVTYRDMAKETDAWVPKYASLKYNGDSNTWTANLGFAMRLDDKSNNKGFNGAGLGLEAFGMLGYTYGANKAANALSINGGLSVIQRANPNITKTVAKGSATEYADSLYNKFMTDAYGNAQDTGLVTVSGGWVRDYTTGENNWTYDAYLGNYTNVYDNSSASFIKKTYNPITKKMEKVEWNEQNVKGFMSTLSSTINQATQAYGTQGAEAKAIESNISQYENAYKDLEKQALATKDQNKINEIRAQQAEILKTFNKEIYKLTGKEPSEKDMEIFNENTSISVHNEMAVAAQNKVSEQAIQIAKIYKDTEEKQAAINKKYKEALKAYYNSGEGRIKDKNGNTIDMVPDIQLAYDLAGEQQALKEDADAKIAALITEPITVKVNGSDVTIEKNKIMDFVSYNSMPSIATEKVSVEGYFWQTNTNDKSRKLVYVTTNKDGEVNTVPIEPALRSLHPDIKKVDSYEDISKLTIEKQDDGTVIVGVISTGTENKDLGTVSFNGNALFPVSSKPIYTNYSLYGEDNHGVMGNADISKQLSMITDKSQIPENNVIFATDEAGNKVTDPTDAAFITINTGKGIVVGTDGSTKSQEFTIEYGSLSAGLTKSVFQKTDGSANSLNEITKAINAKVAQIQRLSDSIDASITAKIESFNRSLAGNYTPEQLNQFTNAMLASKEELQQSFAAVLQGYQEITDKLEAISEKGYTNIEEMNAAIDNLVNSVANNVNLNGLAVLSMQKTIVLGAEEDAKRKDKQAAWRLYQDEFKNSHPGMIKGDMPTTAEIKKILADKTLSKEDRANFIRNYLASDTYRTGKGNENGLLSNDFAQWASQDPEVIEVLNMSAITSDPNFDKNKDGSPIKLGSYVASMAKSYANMAKRETQYLKDFKEGKVTGFITDYSLKKTKTIYDNITKNNTYDGAALSNKIKTYLNGFDKSKMTDEQKASYVALQDLAEKAGSSKNLDELLNKGGMPMLDYFAQTQGWYPFGYADDINTGKGKVATSLPSMDITKTGLGDDYGVNGATNILGLNLKAVASFGYSDAMKYAENGKKTGSTANPTAGKYAVNYIQGYAGKAEKQVVEVNVDVKKVTAGEPNKTVTSVIKTAEKIEHTDIGGTANKIGGIKDLPPSSQKPSPYQAEFLPIPVISTGPTTTVIKGATTGLDYVKYSYDTEMSPSYKTVNPMSQTPDINFNAYIE